MGIIVFLWYILTRPRQKFVDSIDNKINDIENILTLLIFSMKDGNILFSKYLSTLQLQTDYLHGLIETVNIMAKNIGEKAKLRRMEYDRKIIVIHHGKFVRAIILCKDNPSNYLEDSLTIIAKRFEEKYLEELQANIHAKFSEADKIINDVFGKNLMEIKTVLWTDTDESKDLLTKDEIKILQIAAWLKTKYNFFTTAQLVKNCCKKIDRSMKDTLQIIEELATRKYIVNYYSQVKI